jgi:GMP synthase (glutamine-hydrolysing)
MRLNDMTDVIKKHIIFASNCFTQKKKILAICWGLQVCSTAAGGKVNPGKNGAHIGIASDVIINNEGEKHFIYKDKKKIFTSPAFNFDEVSELPKNAILLSSDRVNNVMGVSFNAGNSEIIGLQYHPDYEYFQMLKLIAGRKERLFVNKNFSSEEEYESHVSYIKSENELLNFNDRTCEVRNWLNYLKN